LSNLRKLSNVAGFTLLEVMIVILLGAIVSAVAMVQMRTTITMLDADAAANLVVSQLNFARQTAIDDRRNVLVEFLHSNEIKVTRNESGGGTTVLSDVTLPTPYSFGLPTGVSDTPDAFGNSAAVYFNGGTSGTFLSDETFVDGANVLLNGSAFTIASTNGTARAITLTGATGKVKLYWVSGSSWVVE
jgi:prepilin-type N-terminal cleavage/methylation domain-containing protein